MRVDRFTTKCSIALLALTVSAGIVAGCGGGGGGSSSSGGGSGTTSSNTGGQTYVYSGTLTTNGTTVVPNDTVEFDGLPAYKSTTDSNGNFSITVPSGSIQGTNYLTAFDPSGNLLTTITLPSGALGETGIQFTLGPPPPPKTI